MTTNPMKNMNGTLGQLSGISYAVRREEGLIGVFQPEPTAEAKLSAGDRRIYVGWRQVKGGYRRCISVVEIAEVYEDSCLFRELGGERS